MSKKILYGLTAQSGGGGTGGQKLYQHNIKFSVVKDGYMGLYETFYVRWILPQADPITTIQNYCSNTNINSIPEGTTPLLSQVKYDKGNNEYYIYFGIRQAGSNKIDFCFWDIKWTAEDGLTIGLGAARIGQNDTYIMQDKVTELKES